MSHTITEPGNLPGLSQHQAFLLLQQHGKNVFRVAPEHRFLRILGDIFREPMSVMLVIACSLYFILGEINEGILMAAAVCIVGAISLYQEAKSSRAIRALKQFTEPKITVIRDRVEQLISSEELVPGDVILLEEGMKIPADALVLQQNDLSIDESVITGESLPVEKSDAAGHNLLYQGCLVNRGKCIARVTATGNNTVLGKIGKSIAGYGQPKTLLQVQVNKFVKKLALFGLVAFLVIFLVNYFHYGAFATSLLFALTLAMSVVPEEIPVAFSSFMALGAYKMSKFGIISRQPQVIENLGAVTVLCLDKTGTITENKMQVRSVYDHATGTITDLYSYTGIPGKNVLLYGVLASESNPFDTMEKAIWEAWRLYAGNEAPVKTKMIHEYPLEGQPPMMTHVYEAEGMRIAAAKGAAERVLRVFRLDDTAKLKVTRHTRDLAAKGYRVLGVASAVHRNQDLPVGQDEFDWQFEGLLALWDPPKKNIPGVLKKIYAAQIEVKLITGDYPETTMAIAGLAGMLNPSHYCTGEAVMAMSAAALQAEVKTTHLFARMFPDAKMKVVNAIRANGDIVAMTGDGVNDGPALKAADIGIAMGKKGTETARQASDLILTDDNLEKIVIAVREGRKVYNNLVKAIRYIISIHIPIILTASLPVILGWSYPNIFTPVHVIFLELIMGPTCSVFFEREPVEESTILAGPRNRKAGLFTYDEFLISVAQGAVITAGVLALYYFFMTNAHSIKETRAMVFTTIILSNVFLTFASRSFTQTIYKTIRYKNSLAPFLIIISAVFLALLHFVAPVRQLFGMAPVTLPEFGLCFITAFACTMWFEVYKAGLEKT
jgi:P-type Ca2+ transporter type 2C